ncbi:MAG: IPT/TIG domain-containing protein, partial [Chitinophagales bacterium]
SQETGGYLFTRIDTSINNVFDNIVALLIEVNTAINDRANTDVINQLSEKLELQIGLISKESKDNINLTFSNSQFLIDKTTNAVMVVTAVIFLAIGFLIVVYLLTKAELTTFSRLATLMAMSVYMVFFGVMTFFTPFRVALVSGFELRDLNNQPRITGISPKKVSSTNTKTITIQGEYFSSVHKVNALTVRLQQFQLGKTPTTFYKLPTTTQLAFDETQLMLIFPKKGLNLPAGHYQLQIWYEQVLLQSPQLLEVY